MGFLDRILGRPTPSAEVAKERLQFVLAHDRSDISPRTLDVLKDEIIAVISKHVEVDREHVEVSITRVGSTSRLVANIPVREPRVPRLKPPPRRAAHPAQKSKS
jgi:cell division topological specificity factor